MATTTRPTPGFLARFLAAGATMGVLFVVGGVLAGGDDASSPDGRPADEQTIAPADEPWALRPSAVGPHAFGQPVDVALFLAQLSPGATRIDDVCTELAGPGWTMVEQGGATVSIVDGRLAGWSLSADGSIPAGLTIDASGLGASIGDVRDGLAAVRDHRHLAPMGVMELTGTRLGETAPLTWWAPSDRADDGAVVTLVMAGVNRCE